MELGVHSVFNRNKLKCKAIPITGLWGTEGSGWLRLQITRHSAHEGGLYPQEYPGTHF